MDIALLLAKRCCSKGEVENCINFIPPTFIHSFIQSFFLVQCTGMEEKYTIYIYLCLAIIIIMQAFPLLHTKSFFFVSIVIVFMSPSNKIKYFNNNDDGIAMFMPFFLFIFIMIMVIVRECIVAWG